MYNYDYNFKELSFLGSEQSNIHSGQLTRQIGTNYSLNS
jgi:hypothetical protein